MDLRAEQISVKVGPGKINFLNYFFFQAWTCLKVSNPRTQLADLALVALLKAQAYEI